MATATMETVPGNEYALRELMAHLPDDLLPHHRANPGLYPQPHASITTYGLDPVVFLDGGQRTGKYYLENTSPAEREWVEQRLFEAIERDRCNRVWRLPLNSHPLGFYKPVFDFDGGTVERPRVLQIAWLYHTVLAHFACERRVIVAVNDKGNYHVHLPGMLCLEGCGGRAARRVHYMASRIDPSVPNKLRGDFDEAPVVRGRIRVHGTGNWDRQGQYNPRSEYRFLAGIAHDGTWLTVDDVTAMDLSNVPSADQILEFMCDPRAALPLITTTFAAGSDTERCEKPGEWTDSDVEQLAGADAFVIATTPHVLLLETQLPATIEPCGHLVRVCARLVEGGAEQFRAAYTWVLCTDDYCEHDGVVRRGKVQALPSRATLAGIASPIRKPLPRFAETIEPFVPERFLDLPLEMFVEPKGFHVFSDGKQQLDGPKRATGAVDVISCAQFFAKWHGRSLRDAEVERLTLFERVLDPTVHRGGGGHGILSRRTLKPFMMLGLDATQHGPQEGGAQWVILEAPPDHGKSFAARRMAIRRWVRGHRIWVLVPLETLSNSWHSDMQRAVADFVPNEQALAATEGMTQSYPLEYPSQFVHYKSATGLHEAQEARSADVLTMCINSVVKFVSDRGLPVEKPEIVVIDEIRTVIEALFTAETFRHNRMQVLTSLLWIVNSAKLVIFLDKNIGPLVNMFLGLALAFRASRADALHIDPVLIQRYVVYDHSDMVLALLPDTKSVVPLVRRNLERGKKVILFEPYKKVVAECVERLCEKPEELGDDEQADADAQEAESLFRLPRKQCMTITADTDSAERREFSSNPRQVLESRDIRFFTHNQAAHIGVNIAGEYFNTIVAVQRGHVSWRENLQAFARARDQISSDGLRRVVLAFPKTVRRMPAELHGMPTIGTALWEFKVRAELERERVDPDMQYLVRYDSFGRLVVPENDPVVLMAIVFYAQMQFARRVQWAQCEVWANSNGVPMIELPPLTDGETKDARVEAVERAEDSRVRRLAVRNGDDQLTRRKKIRAAAQYGVDEDSPLLESVDFMRFASGNRGENECRLWLWGAMLVDATLEEVRKLEQQRLVKWRNSGVAGSLADSGLVAEFLLLKACSTWLNIDLKSGQTLGPQMRTDAMPAPWKPDEMVTQEQFFERLSHFGHGLVGRGAKTLIHASKAQRFRNVATLKDVDWQAEDLSKRDKQRRRFFRSIVTACVGKVFAARRGSVLPVQCQRYASLVKPWSAYQKIEFPREWQAPVPELVW